jgi:hypothetical protein
MKKIMFLCSVILIAFAVMAGDEDAKSGASKKIPMKKIEAKKFVFHYRIFDGQLTAKLAYPTKGWVAVGFKPSKKMKDANIIIGYAKGDVSEVEDHFGIKATKHKADTEIGGKNSIVKGGCKEKDGVTVMWFVIPTDSGDDKDVVLKEGEELKVIFAAGKKDGFGFKHAKVAGLKITL